MLKDDVHRRRKSLPARFREEVESCREQFFRSGETGRALTAILRYAKLPANLNVCERAFKVTTEVVCAWIRELPSEARSNADYLHRCDYTAGRVQHALNWANALLRRPAPYRKFASDKDIFATRFITEVRDAATAALPALASARCAAQARDNGSQHTDRMVQRSLFGSEG